MNSVVSFETAKLLKENGFINGFGDGQKFYFPDTKELTENHRGNNYPAPTIAEVVMWLYEKYGIWISVNHSRSLLFYPYIYKNGEQIEGGEYSYDLISEAYEASIGVAYKWMGLSVDEMV